MKLIKWNTDANIEAYTVTKEFGDMSFNNPDQELILNNRKKLAKYLNTDLDHMVAPHQVHSANFKEVSIADGGKGIYDQERCILITPMLYIQKMLICFFYHFMLIVHPFCYIVLKQILLQQFIQAG